jgi:hypothetical protein
MFGEFKSPPLKFHEVQSYGVVMALTLKALANFSPGFALKPWVHDLPRKFFATLKELRQALDLRGDATLSGLRLTNTVLLLPRVARAQPWADISERFQR